MAHCRFFFVADEICFNLPSARGAVDNSHARESTKRRECFFSLSLSLFRSSLTLALLHVPMVTEHSSKARQAKPE